MELIVQFLIAFITIVIAATSGWLYAKSLRRLRPAPGLRPAVPYQAPRPLPEFVGRRNEIQHLTQVLQPGGKAAIIGVMGMAGIGKTELAKIIVHGVASRYRDGVLWADCGQERLAEIADRWAGAYGVEKLPGDDLATKAPSWRGLISNKEALLVFDNVQLGGEIEPLFPPKGRSTVLITTRHADHPALEGAETLQLGHFTRIEALDLAERVLGWEGARDQRADAVHLFDLVGYLPLAISIALRIAQESDWTLAELNQKLERAGAIRLLKEPDQEWSLWATFQTAWDNLPRDLQRAFASLAVFNQGPSFDTWAMAAVLEAEETEARALVNRLDGRSLLTQAGDGRWSLHPLLQGFAAEKLSAEDPAWDRMAAHYVEVARAAETLYLRGGEDLLPGLNLFDLEWPHIRAGQAWATAHAGIDEKATQLCSDYPDASAYCLDLRLHPQERIAWLEAAVTAARRLGDRKAEGVHLGNLGLAYADLGEVSKSIRYYEQAVEIHREIGDRRGEGADLGNLGLAYAAMGEYRRAIEYHEQALAIAHEIGDRREEGANLGNLGWDYAALSEYRRAIECHEQALAIAQEIGDRRGEGDRLGNLGWDYAALGEYRRAIECHEQALTIAREIGDREGEGRHLGNLGKAYTALGDVQKAIECYVQGLAIAREIGDQRGEGDRLGNLGVAYKQLGDVREAIEYNQQALAIAREIGDRRGQGRHLGNLGLAYAALGETIKAIKYYRQALEIRREIGDRRGEGNELANMGQAYKRLGDMAKARELLEEALRIYEAIEAPPPQWVRGWLAELEG